MQWDNNWDNRWPIQYETDPSAYREQLLSWLGSHYDCPGFMHTPGNPCPTPPALPRWQHCPPGSIADKRLSDCGGCGDCENAEKHACHLSGENQHCAVGGEVQDGAITAFADYDLITRVAALMAMDDDA